jgi:hypothetical protein
MSQKLMSSPLGPVAFRPTLTDGLALSIDPILAGWEYMPKQKPGRAISNCILDFPQTHINSTFLSHINTFGLFPDDRYHLQINKKAGLLLTLPLSLLGVEAKLYLSL